MREIAFGDAKAHLSELLAALEAGQMVTITRDNKTVASVIPDCGECSGRLAALMRVCGPVPPWGRERGCTPCLDVIFDASGDGGQVRVERTQDGMCRRPTAWRLTA